MSRPLNFPQATINKFIWSERKTLSNGLFLGFMRVLTLAPFPFLFQVMVDEYVLSANIAGIFSMSAIILGLLLLHYGFAITSMVSVSAAGIQIERGLRSKIFHKLQFLHFGYLDTQKSGRLLAKYAFDTQKVELVIVQLVSNFIPNIAYSAMVIGVLALLNWKLTLVVIGFLPIYGISRWWFFSRIQVKNRALRLAHEDLTGTANEYISALRLVRGYGQEGRAIDSVEDSSEIYSLTKIEQNAVNHSFGAFAFTALQLLTLCVVAGGSIIVIQGHMTIGTLFAFLTALPVIVMPINLFLALSQQYFAGKEGFFSIRELLNSAYVEDWNGRQRPKTLRGDIAFDNIVFRYNPNDRPAIDGISFHIAPGEHIALVGSSGSGKSTIANLLLGLYKPQEGEIRIDGIPQASLDMRWLRQHSAIVMQESLLLSGSVIDNIRFARIDATDEEVYEAARLANANEFIERLPNGFDTVVGERGAMLSGGQRQRLSIARAVLRDPRILILDEATSALDYESERLIQSALERLSKGRSVITIAHRLSTVRHADRLIVMKHGQIMEQGSYDELSENGEHFKALLASAGT